MLLNVVYSCRQCNFVKNYGAIFETDVNGSKVLSANVQARCTQEGEGGRYNKKWLSSENREIRRTKKSVTIECACGLLVFLRIIPRGISEMTMYTLKPIISLTETLHHRKAMYEMRNIHEERSTDDHTETENRIVPDITEQSPLPEYNALEARQEMILAQLAELKQQVSVLSSFLKQTNHIARNDSCPKSQELITVNLIVNVNPRRPPYFISALQRIWEDIEIRVQSYVHSNVSTEGLKSYHSTTAFSGKNIINLTLIWKDVQDLELVSGLQRYHITGETNVLRYLSRLFESHSYENSACEEKINRINLILDLCHSIHFAESSKKQQEIVLLIADNIDTNWPDKKTPDIADIAAWSTIKQVFPKKYPLKLNRWFGACEKLFV